VPDLIQQAAANQDQSLGARNPWERETGLDTNSRFTWKK